MTYTNLHIDRYSIEINRRKDQRLMEAELAFWRAAAEDFQGKLENIPAAIEKYGYLDVSYGDETMRLVREKSEDAA